MKRLKELETENARLRRAVSDLTLDKMILAEAARGNFQAAPAVVLAWIMSPQSWVCPGDRHVGCSASIVPRSAKPPRHRMTKRH